MKVLEYIPVSMVTYDDLQRLNILYESEKDVHLFLTILNGEKTVAENIKIAFKSGKGYVCVMVPVAKNDFTADVILIDKEGKQISKETFLWRKPRKWTIYSVVASHMDIGLHNSQYIQRYEGVERIEKAMSLADSTDNEKDENKYRYTIEGTWLFNNFSEEKGTEKTKELVEKYIKQNKLGVCGEIAGAHTQNYGLEELCRSTYELKKLKEKWDIDTAVYTMTDNNGISWAMIQPYAEAGYKNLLFSPNQWNPLPSKIWHNDTELDKFIWNTEAGGGGSRIDIRYDSEHPMLFFWEDSLKKNKILVWGSTSYYSGGLKFGLNYDAKPESSVLSTMENSMAHHLPFMEKKYELDVWIFSNYMDDQDPDMNQTLAIKMWNEKYKYPKLRTAGDVNIPFDIVRKKYASSIPVITGELTGGWYQHPISAPEILSRKHYADRKLPTAEKFSSVAAILDDEYKYPALEFERAWDGLLYHDEHSYGVSGYQGRRVYETWIQHYDWVNKATLVADKNTKKAIDTIKKHIQVAEASRILFNPTMLERKIYDEKTEKPVVVPPFGYTTVGDGKVPKTKVDKTSNPPTIENSFYKIIFDKNGAMSSIYDKKLKKELIKKGKLCNNIMYTDDNHISFKSPTKAHFEVITSEKSAVVISYIEDSLMDAKITQRVTLENYEKRIDISNKIEHARDLINNKRYYRYLYYGFEFDVKNCKRLCNINGSVAEYGVDITGHGTDTYMSANEWCAVENDEYGVALFQRDTELVEFAQIHQEKTDYGDLEDGSEIYSYVANDWLQMHSIGGSHLNYEFEYAITSYENDYKSVQLQKQVELFLNPIIETTANKQNGTLPKEHSFIKANTDARLINIKLSDDKKGFIFRFLGDTTDIKIDFMNLKNQKRVTIDERTPKEGLGSAEGFTTYKLDAENISVEAFTNSDTLYPDFLYTGLMTTPMALPGENEGMLYLLWGQDVGGKVKHYNLYRSETSGFEPNKNNLIAEVKPEEYRCTRYIDENLKAHYTYYYKIVAVYEDGSKGNFTDEFVGVTKETAKNVL